MKAYREWLPADGYEGTGSLGGSYYSDDIADYYRTPHELGYWPFVKFDHDFIGREALEAMGDEPRCGRSRWRGTARTSPNAIGTQFEKGDPVKYIDVPLSNYSTWPNDKVLQRRRVRRPLDLLRLQLQRAFVPVAGDGRLSTSSSGPRSRSSGARRTAAPPSRSSSGTCRPRSARSSARRRTREVARSSYHEGWRTKAAV